MQNILTDYMLVIIPPNPVKNEVEKIKMQIKEHLLFDGFYSLPPYIKLLKPFKWDFSKEYLLVHHIKSVVPSCFSFSLEISNFGVCKETQTIYAKIEDTEELNYCKKTIKNYFKDLLDSDITEESLIPKNLIIGNGDLKQNHLVKAWNKIKNNSYNGSFLANQFMLYQNVENNWQQKYQFDLD